jgi:tRNA(fMet)-specific endonuclease VapC
MTHLLDTDHISILQKQDGRDWGVIVGHIAQVGQKNVALSVVSFHEQLMGLHSEMSKPKNQSDLPRWYQRMSDMIDLYSKSNLLTFDDSAFVQFQTFSKKIRVKPMDIRIASIALANDLTLVTRNTSDFARVPNLKLEDWTK